MSCEKCHPFGSHRHQSCLRVQGLTCLKDLFFISLSLKYAVTKTDLIDWRGLELACDAGSLWKHLVPVTEGFRLFCFMQSREDHTSTDKPKLTSMENHVQEVNSKSCLSAFFSL